MAIPSTVDRLSSPPPRPVQTGAASQAAVASQVAVASPATPGTIGISAKMLLSIVNFVRANLTDAHREMNGYTIAASSQNPKTADVGAPKLVMLENVGQQQFSPYRPSIVLKDVLGLINLCQKAGVFNV